jgi:hypothetical protein
MIARKLSAEETRETGYTHSAIINAADLIALGANASGVIKIVQGLAAGHDVQGCAMWLKTAFDGGDTSALALDVGFNGATVDDDDAFIDNIEIHEDATEVLGDRGSLALSAAALNATDSTSTIDETWGAAEVAVLTGIRTGYGALRTDVSQANRLANGWVFREAADIEAKFTATGANLNALTVGEVRIFIRVVDLRKL